MKKDSAPDTIDVLAFTRTGGSIVRDETLARFPRLLEETAGAGADRPVRWQAAGELRTALGGVAQPWLHLEGSTVMPLTCQRCLLPVDVPVAIERSFRFVADEATAEAEDDDAEEDLLVLERDFAVHDLAEDEFIMAVPPVPVHDVCPVQLPMAVADPDFEAAMEEKPNPFAVLANLQKGKGS